MISTSRATWLTLFAILVMMGAEPANSATRIRCESAEGEEVKERGRVDLVISDSGKFSGTTRGRIWNGFRKDFLEFNFEVASFSPASDSRVLSSGELHQDPPRYSLQPDQTLDIDQRSVALILLTFDGPLLGVSALKAELFFYQRYFIHDLFVDGGQLFSLKCQKEP